MSKFIQKIITQKEYDKFYETETDKSISKSQPVTDVKYIHAILFCNQLSKKDGLTPCYYTQQGNVITVSNVISPEPPVCKFDSEGWRLPTSKEYELQIKENIGDYSEWCENVDETGDCSVDDMELYGRYGDEYACLLLRYNSKNDCYDKFFSSCGDHYDSYTFRICRIEK